MAKVFVLQTVVHATDTTIPLAQEWHTMLYYDYEGLASELGLGLLQWRGMARANIFATSKSSKCHNVANTTIFCWH